MPLNLSSSPNLNIGYGPEMTHSNAAGKPLTMRVREALDAVAEPARAPAMQAYMKSAMPYLGVSTVPRRAALKPVFAGLDWPDSAAWQADVLALWRGATHREERYAAIELSGVKAARRFQRIDALPMYEEMIVTGAWWDYVDEIAGHRLWTLLQNDRAAMRQDDAGLVDRYGHVEAAKRDPLPIASQARDRPRSALRLYRTVDRIGRILPAQGDRLGAAPICLDRCERSRTLCRAQCGSTERPEQTRGAQE
jgi:hypothetical protein